MPQAISVVKGDFQTFKLMILKAIDCKSISRKKDFQEMSQITILTVSLANPDVPLRSKKRKSYS